LKSRQSQQSEFWGAGSRLSIRDFGCRVAAQHMRFEVPGRVSLSFRRFGVPGRVSLSTRRFGVPGRVSALEIWGVGSRQPQYSEIWVAGSRPSQHSRFGVPGRVSLSIRRFIFWDRRIKVIDGMSFISCRISISWQCFGSQSRDTCGLL